MAIPPRAAQLTGDLAQRLPDGSLFVPKPVQRILAIRTVLARTATHRKTLELPGPHHSRSECQRLCAGLGQRPAFCRLKADFPSLERP